MVCWKGDPSVQRRVRRRSAKTFCELSEGTLQTKVQVLADKSDKPWKINTWHGRTAMYLAMGAQKGNATNSRKFQRGERESRFHSPTSSESLEPDAPSNPQPWTFKWNVVHYRNRARRNIWRTKDWRVLHVKKCQEYQRPNRRSDSTIIIPNMLFLSASQSVNVSPLDCSSANFSLPESWSMKLVEKIIKNLWPPEERTSHYSQLAVQKWGATWRT